MLFSELNLTCNCRNGLTQMEQGQSHGKWLWQVNFDNKPGFYSNPWAPTEYALVRQIRLFNTNISREIQGYIWWKVQPRKLVWWLITGHLVQELCCRPEPRKCLHNWTPPDGAKLIPQRQILTICQGLFTNPWDPTIPINEKRKSGPVNSQTQNIALKIQFYMCLQNLAHSDWASLIPWNMSLSGKFWV